MALTPKQEHFCRLVAGGKDYTNAYLTAYDWHGSTAGAQQEGLKLANREDVQAKIQALLKPMEIAQQKDSVNARQRQIDFILERIEICKQKDDEQSIIRYTDMLNKINALYKDTETPKAEESGIVSVNTDLLKKLSGVS